MFPVELDISILGPALLAGLLVLATHVPLGITVLQRGIIFLDLAIAQIAGVGVIYAHTLHEQPDDWIIQLIATLSAISGAIFLRWCERRWPDIQEAMIGVVFVVSACIGMLLLANNPHGGEHLKDLLAGQILWVNSSQLQNIALLSAIVLVLWFFYPRLQRNIGFYILFAITITASVQLVGVYLVFSSLIIPALATWRVQKPVAKIMTAYLCGLGGYFVGLIVSSILDLPSSPVIVLCLTLCAVILWQFIGKRTDDQTGISG